MHVQEKQAWFMLIVMTVTVALWLALVAVFGFHPAFYGVFGLLGLLGFVVIIGRRERKAGLVTIDERDQQIALNATTGSYSVFWLLFVATAMGPFIILGPDATLTLRTTTICIVVWPAMMVVLVVRSLIIVVLYRRGYRA